MTGIFDDTCGSANQSLNATSTKICFENSVRVVEITDNQIEAGEVIGQFPRQLRVTSEKSGERRIFDRLHRLGIEPIFCKHCNVLVAENLHMGLRPRVTKRFECRQGENEIADRTAADYQNAVHAIYCSHGPAGRLIMKRKQFAKPATGRWLQRNFFSTA